MQQDTFAVSHAEIYDPPAPAGGVEPQRAGIGWWDALALSGTHRVIGGLLWLLRLGGLYRFGRVFGAIEWCVNHRRRRRFGAALQRILGREPTTVERRKATREFFMRSRCDKLFYLAFDRIPRARALELLSIGNASLLDEAVNRGRGVYLAMSHHGALHVIALLTALRGYKTAGVRDRREGPMRQFIQQRLDRRYPEFQRMRVLFADSYPRDIYRCLRDGYLVGSAMDVTRLRHANQKTEEVILFGEKQLFLSGPLRIAFRCGAPVLQAFVIAEEAFHYRLEIVEMLIDPDRTDADESTAVRQAMQTYAANVESYLRRLPSLMTRIG